MKSLRFFTLSQLMRAAREYKKWHLPNRLFIRYSRSRRTSGFDGLNFDCVTNINTFSLTVPVIFCSLFAYLSYNFYGVAMCIKAVYTWDAQCQAFLGWNFSKSENFDRFWICPRRKWVNPNNIITNAHWEPKLPTVEQFEPLSAWNGLVIYFSRGCREIYAAKI